jgi:hypothetical protein
MEAFGWSTTQPFSQIVGGEAIALSAKALSGFAELVAKRVERLTKQQLETDEFGSWLGSMMAELKALDFATMNQGHHANFSNAALMLQMIDSAIPAIPPREPKVNWEDLKEQKSLMPRDLTTRLRSIDTRLAELDPRSKDIAKKITDIENAHTAAEQLPTDLAELTERRDELSKLIESTHELSERISQDGELTKATRNQLETDVAISRVQIERISKDADGILAKSEHALRGATAVGLSKAFEARKRALALSGLGWVFGLAIALIIAVVIGWERVTTLKDVLNGGKSPTIVVVNAMLAILAIGAPVWFAWLSTKQVGITFRLSEDYAFKASVAQAYEGYRTEAMEIDDEMRSRLFSAALDRFEEAPIRLVDTQYHSSPLQEALSNPAIRKALNSVPNLTEKIIALIPSKTNLAVAAVTPIALAATVLDEKQDKSGEEA